MSITILAVTAMWIMVIMIVCYNDRSLDSSGHVGYHVGKNDHDCGDCRHDYCERYPNYEDVIMIAVCMLTVMVLE